MALIRRRLLQLAGAWAALAPAGSAYAQAYPSRPVRVIVTTGPGGQGDTTARLVAQKLTEALGQSFYVENMGGAGGNLAMRAAARAAPDGYTVLAATSNLVTNPSLYPNPPYDPEKDLAPVTLMATSPHVLVVHPSLPARTANELVALAKADPGKLSYASAGRGTPAHLAGELFKLTFDVDITHVPFNGGGPGVSSTLGGHTSMSVSAVPTAVAYIKAGNLRALGVIGSRRSSALPDVPTMAEATGRELVADIVNGFMVPAGTPTVIIDVLHGAVARIMAMPDVRERMIALGFEPIASTPAEFAAWIKTETPKWAKVIRDAKITLQ